MPVLPLALGWLVLAADPLLTISAGYCPPGTPVDLHDLDRLARLRDRGVQAVGFEVGAVESPAGTLAEADGPGIIQRIWFGHPRGNRTTERRRTPERLQIYLDGHPRPALDLPLPELFAGRHPHFPRPLVDEVPGGMVSYVPIAFRDGCRVVVEGPSARCARVSLTRLPGARAEGVATFTAIPSEAERAALRRAATLWSHPESLEALGIAEADLAEYAVEGGARSTEVYLLPAGPRTIRLLEVSPTPETADAWRIARCRLIWEGDDPEGAGVDLPLGFLFGEAFASDPFQSVLVGRGASTWSNRSPMPYRHQALLQITSELPLKGSIRIRTRRGVPSDAGYFRATLHARGSSEPQARGPWLIEEGRGHFVGMFLAALIEDPRDLRRVARVRFQVDGRRADRGTSGDGYFAGSCCDEGGRVLQSGTHPLFGISAFHRGHGTPSRVSAYRWHLADPIPFAHSIAVEVGRSHEKMTAFDPRVAIYWYSERPGPARAGR